MLITDHKTRHEDSSIREYSDIIIPIVLILMVATVMTIMVGMMRNAVTEQILETSGETFRDVVQKTETWAIENPLSASRYTAGEMTYGELFIVTNSDISEIGSSKLATSKVQYIDNGNSGYTVCIAPEKTSDSEPKFHVYSTALDDVQVKESCE